MSGEGVSFKKVTPLFLGLLVLLFILSLLQNRFNQQPVLGLVIANGAPVENAAVHLQGKGLLCGTDNRGEFRISGIPEGGILSVAKPGYFINNLAARRGINRVLLQPISAEDHWEYSWAQPRVGEGNCFQCHEKIVEEWEKSGHARSVSSPGFVGMYKAGEVGGKILGWSLWHDYPDGRAVCAACHAPAVKETSPALHDLTKVKGEDVLGVHCDFCHKISGTRKKEPGLTHGRDFFELKRPKEGQVFFGPLPDATREDNSYSPLFKESLYCAGCHEGTLFGVPVYTTWSEWKASPAALEGKSCQHCHMARSEGTNVAPGHGGIFRSSASVSSHTLSPQGVLPMLKNSLQMDLGQEKVDDKIRVQVRLKAEGVGHKVPTGYIDRHLILLLEAKDDAGNLVAPLNGTLLPIHVGHDWEGKPGFLFAKLLLAEGKSGPVPFWETNQGIRDTRLEPGKPQDLHWDFPPSMRGLKARLIYRKFWKEQERVKRWQVGDQVVLEKSL